MIRTGHPAFSTAFEELYNSGYREGFSSPGRPRLFVRGKPGARQQRCAIARVERSRSTEWRIVDYPEPAIVSQFDDSVERGGDYENS